MSVLCSPGYVATYEVKSRVNLAAQAEQEPFLALGTSPVTTSPFGSPERFVWLFVLSPRCGRQLMLLISWAALLLIDSAVVLVDQAAPQPIFKKLSVLDICRLAALKMPKSNKRWGEK